MENYPDPKVGDKFIEHGEEYTILIVSPDDGFRYQRSTGKGPIYWRDRRGTEPKWLSVKEKHAPEQEDNLGTDPIKQAQKRILEKAIERLERKKRCDSYLGYKWKHPCIACGEAGESERNGGDCVDAVIDMAIAELKSLMGEVCST